MTNSRDPRVAELVTRLVEQAPPAPAFPDEIVMRRGSPRRRVAAGILASALIAGAGVAAWRLSRPGDAPDAVRRETPVTVMPVPDDPRVIVVGGDRTIRLRNRPHWVGSGIGTGTTATPDGRFVAYEYDTPTAHEIAAIDTKTCDANACTETVIASGHSPVLSAEGALAYVALDDGSPTRPDEAMWKRSGSVTVRGSDGATRVWAHDDGFQTIGWAGNTLLVEHDRPDAQTEGFEELMLYRGPDDRVVLTLGLVAISPDGARLLLAGGTDRMLELYDVAAERIVGSISIAAYERALVPAGDLVGVDLSQWPRFEEAPLWPLSCCVGYSGVSLWQDDLVLIPSIYVRHRTDGAPDLVDLRPTMIRITGDRIVPLRTLRTGLTESYDAQWLPGSTSEFVLKKSEPLPSPGTFLRCRIDGGRAHCNADPSLAWVFRLPTVSLTTPTPTTKPEVNDERPPDVVDVRQLGCADPQPVRVRVELPNIPPGDLEIEVINHASGTDATLLWERNAIEAPDREGRVENFDVPGQDCPGNTQTMTIWVDTPDGTDLHATIPLAFPPPGADGVPTLVLTPALT